MTIRDFTDHHRIFTNEVLEYHRIIVSPYRDSLSLVDVQAVQDKEIEQIEYSKK